MKKFIKIGTQAVATGAGAVSAGLASQRLTFIPRNMQGVAFLALGVVGESMVKNETAKSFMRGVSTYGSIRLAEDTLLKNPDLAGIEGTADFDEIGYVEDDLGALEENAFADINGIDALEEIGYIDDEFAGIDGFDDDEFGEIEEANIDGFDDDEFGEIEEDIDGIDDDEFGEIEGFEDVY